MMLTVDSNPLSLPNASVPLIAKGVAACWPSCKLWTLEYLDEMLSGPLLFRLAKRHSETVQWEPDCQTVFASVGEFRDWLTGTNDSFNPFNPYPKDSWWAYADYVYMSTNDGFDKLLVDLPFDQTFQTPDGITAPTFWLGSSGSNTLCHYDTYGVNIVVQVFGRKNWTLFPNSDTPYMYQTRLPLEESTVFSEINFPTPDYRKHPLLAQTSPRSVVLEPGDVLFVPRGWWHFVQSTTDCQATCAVNWWIDQPELDDRIRLREALTQLMGFSLLSNCQNVNLESKIHRSERTFFNSGNWFTVLSKQIDLLASKGVTSIPSQSSPDNIDAVWSIVQPKSPEELFPPQSEVPSSSQPKSCATISDEDIIKAFLKPDVIDLVAQHLENRE